MHKFLGDIKNFYSRMFNPVKLYREDRAYAGDLLFIDLIPESCWVEDIRDCIDPREYNRLSRHVFARVEYVCECCRRINPAEMQIHARWGYDLATHTQMLMRLIAICGDCQSSTRLAIKANERSPSALKHLCDVRRFTHAECDAHIKNAIKLWQSRNRYTWTLNLSLLENAGIQLVNPRG